MEERLQKIIARAGIASRREAEEMITAGSVTVNGEVVTQLGTKADPERDHIKVNGKLLRLTGEFVYLLLNKPKGVISTVNDPENRPVVTDLIKGVRARIYPVGRLDFNSEGVLLLTNDGELTNRLLSPKSKCPKTYVVRVSGTPTPATLQRMERGLTVDGTRYGPCKIEPLKYGSHSWLKVVLHEGKNHQLKKMFESVGYPVSSLKRMAFAFLTPVGLMPGQWRQLSKGEVERLQKGNYDLPKFFDNRRILKEIGLSLDERDRRRLASLRPNDPARGRDPSVGRGRSAATGKGPTGRGEGQSSMRRTPSRGKPRPVGTDSEKRKTLSREEDSPRQTRPASARGGSGKSNKPRSPASGFPKRDRTPQRGTPPPRGERPATAKTGTGMRGDPAAGESGGANKGRPTSSRQRTFSRTDGGQKRSAKAGAPAERGRASSHRRSTKAKAKRTPTKSLYSRKGKGGGKGKGGR